jgi:tetratricopeptide (TPR) repeat protein
VERIPADTEARAGLYRSLLAGQRMLIVLDNARDTAQARPLLPAGSGCLVIVTSRNQLAGLAAGEGAHLLTLDMLTDGEARALVNGRLGPDRAAAEFAAVDELLPLCARLPLALSVAAARAAARPGLPLAALVAELRDTPGRLDALGIGEPGGDVRAVFSWSYENLTESATVMFRLLGLHPGPDITAPAAASLAGFPLAQARQALAELTAGHLIEEHAPGRFAFHDLLRAYAAEQARTHESNTQRSAAIGRMLDYYLHTAHTGDRLIHPQRDPITLPEPLPRTAAPEHLSDYPQAMAWFEAERRVLLAAVVKAAETRFDAQAWQLAWTLAIFLDLRAYWQDSAAAQQTALMSAVRLGDVTAQAHAHRFLGQAYSQLGSRDDAHVHLRQALDLYERAGDRTGQARTHLDIGHVLDKQARYREDFMHSQQALELFQAVGHQAGQARALNAVGWCHTQLGDHQQALTCCMQALDLYNETGDLGGTASTWDSLGQACHRLGRPAEAVACYQRAFALFRDAGDRYYQAYILMHLGDAHHASGHIQAARDAWQQALEAFDELNHSDTEQIHGKLRDLDDGHTQ